MGLRNMADVTSLNLNKLTADIAKLDLQMKKAGTGATGLKGRLKGMAAGLGTVATAGIFGGAEGLIGSAIGFKSRWGYWCCCWCCNWCLH